jgi:hypothetical protein
MLNPRGSRTIFGLVVCAFGLSRRLRVPGPEIGMGRYKFNSIGISGVKRAAESAGLQNRTWRYKQGKACSKEYNVHAITDALDIGKH